MSCTSSYSKCETSYYQTISISGDGGKKANYQGECFKELAPKLSFWIVWHKNLKNISEEENNYYYVEQYYKHVLSSLDPEEVYSKIGNKILLCYEDNTEFCHRHIVAAWFELLLDKKTPEITFDGCKLAEVNKPDNIKIMLEDVMKKNLHMRGFHSLRALYLFEKSSKIEEKAKELEEQTGECFDYLWQNAAFLRSDADMEEEQYLKTHFSKTKKLR